MPRHVLTMIGLVFAFFVLLWFGIVVLGQTPLRAFAASFLTLFLIGLGITFSTATFRD
jgi:hypothetical protein